MWEGGQHVAGDDDVGPTVSSGLDPLSDGADVVVCRARPDDVNLHIELWVYGKRRKGEGKGKAYSW